MDRFLTMSLAGSLTLLAAAATARADVESTFDADAEGWQAIEFLDHDPTYASIINGPLDVIWDQNDGQPAPCGYFMEPGWFGCTFYFMAPPKFLGNQLDKGTLEWDIRTDPGGPWEDPDVVLWGQVSGSRLVLVNSVPPQASTTWQHLGVDLRDPADWHVGNPTGEIATTDQLYSVLAALEAVFIRGEFRSGVDTSWIDNIRLTSEAPRSSFDTGTEGWQAIEFRDDNTDYGTIFNGPLDIGWDRTDGQPAPSGQFTEPEWFGQTFYFMAAPKFLGNQLGQAMLHWDIRTDPGGPWEQPDVVLWGQVSGSRLVLVNSVPAQATTDWQTLAVNLRNAADWRVGTSTGPTATGGELADVLASLEGLFIRGEFRSGVDSSWIDDVHYTPIGDLNCDGAINVFDIDPFVLAIADPVAYAATWPDCDYMLGDANGDGAVNVFDIDPFVGLIAGND